MGHWSCPYSSTKSDQTNLGNSHQWLVRANPIHSGATTLLKTSEIFIFLLRWQLDHQANSQILFSGCCQQTLFQRNCPLPLHHLLSYWTSLSTPTLPISTIPGGPSTYSIPMHRQNLEQNNHLKLNYFKILKYNRYYYIIDTFLQIQITQILPSTG